MRTPADLAAWAKVTYAHGVRGWLAAGTGRPLELGFPLHPPSEAVVAADPMGAATWVQEWTSFERSAPAGVRLNWTQRRWHGFGDQRLPVRVAVDSAAALAALAGTSRSWQEIVDRTDLLRASWPQGTPADGAADGTPRGPAAGRPDGRRALDEALGGAVAKLSRLQAEDLPRLIAMVNWFLGHPSSGLLPRQVPVVGIDTKWLERHLALVKSLVAALTGSAELGLRAEPRRFRVRSFEGGPLTDFTAAAADLASLDLSPACVLLVENQASMIPLQVPPGVVAIHSQGLAAPELAVVPWIRSSRVLYWGDLDTHGLRILGLVRQVLPQTESVLMCRDTFRRFEALAVTEPVPYRGAIGYLTPEETAVLRLVRAGDHRLEQERIPWSFVTDELSGTLTSASGAP